MKTLVAFLITATMLLQACCSIVDCQPDSIQIYLVSFSSSDIDTIMIRRFALNTNFQNSSDTFLLTNSNSQISVVRGDTSSVIIWDNALFKLHPGFDYEISVPAVHSVTRISNISEVKSSHKQCFVSDGQGPCYNPILSFWKNGLAQNGQVLFIKK